MPNKIRNIPDSPIYLLGICDRFNSPVLALGKYYELTRNDIIGLRDFYISQVFPISAESFHILLLIDNNRFTEITDKKVLLRHETTEKEVGTIDIKGVAILGNDETGIHPKRFTIVESKIPGICPEPGEYALYLENYESTSIIGRFEVMHSQPLPLTEERIKALQSDPLAAKQVMLELGCSKCNDKITIVAGLEKKNLQEGEVWYQDVNDAWKCQCGNVEQTLTYIKSSMHGVLGYEPSPFNLIEQIERNYTHSALEEVARKFWGLIEKQETTEEELQKFLEQNPILLSTFTPELLKFKAPINAKFKTDFALVNQKREIVLIEIEKASTALYTKSGVQHSELTHAINQVEDWLQRARRNRLALIDDLGVQGVTIDNTTNVKGVIIAGRSKKDYEPYIEKVRNRPDIDFYTYDDLFMSLRRIISNIKKI